MEKRLYCNKDIVIYPKGHPKYRDIVKDVRVYNYPIGDVDNRWLVYLDYIKPKFHKSNLILYKYLKFKQYMVNDKPILVPYFNYNKDDTGLMELKYVKGNVVKPIRVIPFDFNYAIDKLGNVYHIKDCKINPVNSKMIRSYKKRKFLVTKHRDIFIDMLLDIVWGIKPIKGA